MFKIKYSSGVRKHDGMEKFNSQQDAHIHLKVKGFRFDYGKNVYEKRVGNRSQEAIIVPV